MPDLGVTIRFEGVKDAEGKVAQFSPRALKALQKAAQDRATIAEGHFKGELVAAYHSAWARGTIAAGLRVQAKIVGNGVDIRFLVPQARELFFMTALGGGHFRTFPVQPFIIRPSTKKALSIPLGNSLARQFIRGEGGRFRGSKGGGLNGRIAVRSVLWGRRTGGFARDVLSEVAQAEGAAFIQDMQKAVAGVVGTMQTTSTGK